MDVQRMLELADRKIGHSNRDLEEMFGIGNLLGWTWRRLKKAWQIRGKRLKKTDAIIRAKQMRGGAKNQEADPETAMWLAWMGNREEGFTRPAKLQEARVATPADWKRDLRRMTKIYRAVETDADAEEAKDLFKEFRVNWDKWIHQRILGFARDQEERPYEKRKVLSAASKVFGLIHQSLLFPTAYNYNTGEYEVVLSRLRKDRPKRIRAYQKGFSDALQAVSEYQAAVEEPGPKEDEHTEIGGVRVIIPAHNTATDSELAAFAKNLQKQFRDLRRAGFASALDGLVIRLGGWHGKSADIGGQYFPASDKLEVFELGFDPQTFTHEVGHRFWFRELSPRGRQMWSEVIEGQEISLSAEDIDDFVDRYLRPKKYRYHTSSELQAEIRGSDLPMDEKAKFFWLAGVYPWHTMDPDERAAIMKSEHMGAKIPRFKISDYAETNPTEAYAEAFALYVTKGPRAIHPALRDLFSRISRTGGAKLRESRVRNRVTRLIRS